MASLRELLNLLSDIGQGRKRDTIVFPEYT